MQMNHPAAVMTNIRVTNWFDIPLLHSRIHWKNYTALRRQRNYKCRPGPNLIRQFFSPAIIRMTRPAQSKGGFKAAISRGFQIYCPASLFFHGFVAHQGEIFYGKCDRADLQRRRRRPPHSRKTNRRIYPPIRTRIRSLISIDASRGLISWRTIVTFSIMQASSETFLSSAANEYRLKPLLGACTYPCLLFTPHARNSLCQGETLCITKTPRPSSSKFEFSWSMHFSRIQGRFLLVSYYVANF